MVSTQPLQNDMYSQYKIRFFQSLKGKLLVFFLALSLIPLSIVSLISFWQNQAILEKRISDEFADKTALQQQSIEQWILERQDDVVTVAELRQVRSMEPDQVGEAVQEFHDRWGIYQNMFVLTPDGERLYDTSGATSNLADRDYFIKAMQGEANVSDILISRVSGKPVIVFAAPVFSGSEVVGVAGAVIPTVYITTLLEQGWAGETGDAYLINQDGYFITEPRFTDELKQAGLFEESPILETQVDTVGSREVLSGNDGTGQYPDYRNQPVLGAYRYLEDLRWGLLLEQEIIEAFSPVTQLRNLMVVISIVSVIVIVAVAIWVAGTLTRPVSKITQAAQSVTQGNLKVKAEVDANDETRILAESFNAMTERLSNLVDTLETRIQERTRALETSAHISRQLNTILDVDELLQRVVINIQNAFGYYHVHIYLVDELTGALIMREGTGEVGQELKAKGHTLQPGQGIVGRVASSGEPYLAPNVDEVAGFFRNPLLPKTQAELAVPIRKGEVILGVLDAQSEEIGGFDQEDLTLMQAIADQMAVALDNARLFEKTQSAVAEAEGLARQLTHDVWQDIEQKVDTTGYVFTRSGVAPDVTEWLPVMGQAVQQKELVSLAGSNGSGTGESIASLAIPLTLRNEVIGVIGLERPGDRVWTDDELTTIQNITEQAALALEAARLTRETQRDAWRNQVVSETTARVWSSSEIEVVMKTAVAELGEKLKAAEVVIRLGAEVELENK